MLKQLQTNNVLTNLSFILVLLIGITAYQMLPRQQDPTINFNWVSVSTSLSGASAEDVEQSITLPLEDAIRNVPDMRYVSSISREGRSSLLIRFEDIDDNSFDKNLADLRRQIQNAAQDLPEEATQPYVLELTTSSGNPTVLIAIVAEADGEHLRQQSRLIKTDFSNIPGIARVQALGLSNPEIQINFDAQKTQALGLSPTRLADSVRLWFKDISAGSLDVNNQSWLVRLTGRSTEPNYLEQLPILGSQSELQLGQLAEVVRGQEKAQQKVLVDGKPAVMMLLLKRDNTNTLELVTKIKSYLDKRNQALAAQGIKLVLVNDSTIKTEQSINLMETNALLGLLLVVLVTWLFLGTGISLITSIGIPFILAGTFWVLWGLGQTLNQSVLLGVVIVLGMLVDDAVVVVEAIHHNLRRGLAPLESVSRAIKEVARPVTAAVLTTIAAFMPLMFLPGVLGKFMQVIPMVVSIALLISLIEAFWMLPAHVISAKISFDKPSKMQRWREKMMHRLQIFYMRVLVKAFRSPKRTLSLVTLVCFLSFGLLASGALKVNFFASDTMRFFYVDVVMPVNTSLDKSLAKAREVELLLHKELRPGDSNAVVTYAGQMFNQTEPATGDRYAQILVGLNPLKEGMRSVQELVADLRPSFKQVSGTESISVLTVAGGPPTSKPIQIKVRGDKHEEIRAAADRIKALLQNNEGILDISDDSDANRFTLNLKPNYDALHRAGINPQELTRNLRLLVDGEVVGDIQHQGEKVKVRVKAKENPMAEIDGLLAMQIPTTKGELVALGSLVEYSRDQSLGNILHYKFRRAITVSANIDKEKTNTLAANTLIKKQWQEKYARQFPNVDLDMSGPLDDIQESLKYMVILFTFGIGVIYLILSTQFQSYYQPFMILITVPMSFTGVLVGLFITNNPLSLYTLYGVVALSGIAVNASIVMLSAANDRVSNGMSVLYAALYAARRRVVPILITSFTTIASLLSLALGVGGHSLVWGPVATAIISGLFFSTILTLIVVPLLYMLSMNKRQKNIQQSRFSKLLLKFKRA